MFQRLAKNKWVSRFRLNLFKHLEGVMVLKCKECLRDQAAARPLAFTLLPACQGCFSRKLLRTSKLSVVTHRTFAYFLGQVQLNCSNQYTKAVTLVIFRLLLTNCRDFYFQGLVLYSSILFFFCFVACFHSFTFSSIFFSCAPATFLSINSIPTFFLQSQPKLHVHVTNFNCHFIIAILESQNSVAQIQDFYSEKISY